MKEAGIKISYIDDTLGVTMKFDSQMIDFWFLLFKNDQSINYSLCNPVVLDKFF